MTLQESRKAVLESVFQRKGGPGRFTNIFEKLDSKLQEVLRREAKLGVDELPILACYRSALNWLLITTDRIVVSINGQIAEIANASVISIVPTEFGKEQKSEWQRLTLKASDGTETVIEVEEGPAFFGVWNVLRNISSHSKSARNQKQ